MVRKIAPYVFGNTHEESVGCDDSHRNLLPQRVWRFAYFLGPVSAVFFEIDSAGMDSDDLDAVDSISCMDYLIINQSRA